MDVIYTCRQFRLLIAGSRDASPAMLQKAREAVARAKLYGWRVLVGDNPKGIDAAVIDACDALGVPVLVFGVTDRPRKGSRQPDCYWQVDVQGLVDDESVPRVAYTTRDRYMVDLCDRALYLHNGRSPGTRAGYEYALRRGKPADILTFPGAATQRFPVRFTTPAPTVLIETPRQPLALHTVQLMIEVEAVSDNDTYQGTVGLQALDTHGKFRHAWAEIVHVQAGGYDAARLAMLCVGLQRLALRLHSASAPYHLHIYQSSREVDAWLAHDRRVSRPDVQALLRQVRHLLKRFPDHIFIKEPEPQLQCRMAKLPR